MILKATALGIMGTFYICYFSKMLSQKKKCIRTDQLGKGKEGFLKFIEIALKITTYLLPLVQVISILIYPEDSCHPLRIAAVTTEMVGVVVFALSVAQMKDNWRAGVQREDKTNLVTSGIYSVSRNPAFLGFDLMYIGILFAFFNRWLLFATLFAVCLFHLQIVNVEEDFLFEAFGEEYLEYKGKVCRYFGRKFRRK
ncbi:MAG: isoprenylcysteine carboxylmethyltransferase family protein [Ruminococcus sp.]|nr:isoprenylcysteine carboxylmethyltransferase family protein [Ruminococcus sp.]